MEVERAGGQGTAIVVLGCRIHPSGRPSAAAARRAAAAADAYRRGLGEIVVASGGRRWGAQVEARALARELVRLGVPREAVVEELWSLTTHENALCVAALLGARGVGRALVVTCPFHLDRAVRDFRAAGLDAVAVPAPEPDAPFAVKVWRAVHEAVSRRLDARALRARSVLAREARRASGADEGAPATASSRRARGPRAGTGERAEGE